MEQNTHSIDLSVSTAKTIEAVATHPQYERVPHPIDCGIIAMFKHQFKSPTEYMLVTEDGDTEHVKPAEQTCDYGAGFFAKADSGAECEDCGSNALHFGDIDISESTSMEVISCIDCGNIQQ